MGRKIEDDSGNLAQPHHELSPEISWYIWYLADALELGVKVFFQMQDHKSAFSRWQRKDKLDYYNKTGNTVKRGGE